jgi:trigger factor
VAFDATVEVRPQIIVPGYGGLRVELPNPRPTDADVDAQIERMRQPFAQTAEVDRPAADGDVVTIDIVGRRDDADEPFIERSDYLYEVGQPDVVEELAEHVRGRSAGDEFGFSVDHADHDHPPLHFEVRVRKVQEKVLPPADDEWAREVSEFGTLAELRADLFARLHRVRAAQARMALRERTSEALAQLVDEEPPETLVQGEMRRRLEDLAMRLSAQGLQIEQYLMATGQDPQAFTDELRRVATESVKIDLALRAVAQAEGLECDDDELDAEYARIAAANNVKPSEVRKAYERNDAVTALRSEIRKRKALEWLVEHAEVVDPDGQPISPADLSPETSSDAAPAAEEVSE